MSVKPPKINESLKGTVLVCQYVSWRESLRKLLDDSDLVQHIEGQKQILIKPNLVEALDPPVPRRLN